MKLSYKLFLILISFFFLTLIIGNLTPQGRSAFHVIGLMPELVPFIPFKTQKYFTNNPIHEKISYIHNSKKVEADLYYLDKKKKRKGVVISLGINPAGRDDPRVVNLGNGFARVGFVVLIPWSKNLSANEIKSEDIENIVGGIKYLESFPNIDKNNFGMAGFCVGASLVNIAAGRTEIEDQIAFINLFGPYYNLGDLLIQIRSKSAFYLNNSRPWHSNELAKSVLNKQLFNLIESQKEKNEIEILLKKKNVSALELAKLSPIAKNVFTVLKKEDQNELKEIFTNLSNKELEVLQVFSPEFNNTNQKAKIYLMHDLNDNVIPVEESRRFANEMKENKNFTYTEFSLFDHVDPVLNSTILQTFKESLKLFKHLYKIVRWAQ